ncbi:MULTISPECIES: hypothetical protein [Novosphingobium]|uniref:Elongation factor P n=1 Tax=Novosphingobium pentaromativorans TaxID=205844 RepID=A0A2W5NUP3_9SPHN|nr:MULTISPECIES: hypothetical protein [Novosphingobium]PZQ56058.1 MAG: hypothetical protein DI555_05270 [Novosphingobium pentaromativorans]GFE74300.1 hypothetical protein NTCA1_19490 [Novosphingobium sp. TCA1]
MTRAPRNAPFAAFLLALGLVAGSGPSLAAKPAPPPVPGGPIGTLDLGQYNCERDGTAGGPVGIRLPQYDFRAVTGSNYKTPDGVRGSYLMTGDQIIMTGGELKGTRMHRTSKGFLRHVGTDGLDNDIRCVLTNAGRGPLEPEDSINQTEE